MIRPISHIEGYPIPLVVAEIGISHGGNLDRLRRQVRGAKDAGVKVCKLQLHYPELEMVSYEMPDHVVRTLVESSWPDEQDFSRICREEGMSWFATPFCTEALVDLYAVGKRTIKVGSGEITNHQLLEQIKDLSTHSYLNVIMSCGLSDNAGEINEALRILSGGNCSVALMHCVSRYPCEYERSQIHEMEALSRNGIKVYGYSDHCIGPHACFAAAANGAMIIEKHFRGDETGVPDEIVACSTDEMAEIVEGCAAIWECMTPPLSPFEPDRSVKEWARHGIWAIDDIEENEKFTEENVKCQRPEKGAIPAHQWRRVIGRRASRRVSVGMPILPQMIK